MLRYKLRHFHSLYCTVGAMFAREFSQLLYRYVYSEIMVRTSYVPTKANILYALK